MDDRKYTHSRPSSPAYDKTAITIAQAMRNIITVKASLKSRLPTSLSMSRSLIRGTPEAYRRSEAVLRAQAA
jgi:hypothetical protein